MLRLYFNNHYKNDIIVQKAWQERVCFYSSLPEFSEKSFKSISGNSNKKVFLKFNSSK